MFHAPTDTAALTDDAVRRMLLSTGRSLLLLAAATLALIVLKGLPPLPRRYFFEQDLPLLLMAGVALYAASRLAFHGRLKPLAGRSVAALCALAGSVAYAGTWFVIERFSMSRDETSADFAATTFQSGWIAWPVPRQYSDIAEAMMPLWTDRWLAHGFWFGNYLPVNALIRAAAGMAGDQWLAGPVLLLVGLAALWVSARRMWPDRPEAWTVAMVLALTSAQLLVNAMTSYATTGHFALNAIWLACFLRGGRSGHAAAILIGVAAVGLHQFHFHLMIVGGFVLWLGLNRRYRLAATYAAACVAYYLIWGIGWWQWFLPPFIGLPTEHLAPAKQFWWQLISKIGLLGKLEPLNSLARFAAWNNILLLPLAWMGWVSVRTSRNDDGEYPVQVAFALICAVGLLTMVYQGHGFGYRYLNGIMPFFCLLAAQGWLSLPAKRTGGAPSQLLWASAAFAVIVTMPFAAWQANRYLHPYAAAYRLMRASPADFVVVDTRSGAFMQDVVRIERSIARPVLLDLAYLTPQAMDRLCSTKRVMIFDRSQAARLGVPAEPFSDPYSDRMRAELDRRRCATPLPLN